MATSKEKKLDQRQRLHEMREHLRVRTSVDDPSFAEDVVATCVHQVQPIIDVHADRTGEEINAAIAKHLGVQFEEVRTVDDINRLEQKYLVEKREIGFAQLADELADRTVDALLFERIHATPDAPDRWVAILNVQKTEARAYWSRPHEIVHRLAEPPQKRLKFFRHRTESEDRLERIIDLGAAELAFPRSVYGARVANVAKHELTWDLIRRARQQFAPTSSLLSAAKAFIRFWPHPAFLLTARLNKSRQRPNELPALRLRVEGFSATSERAQIHFIHNMRVPTNSPMSLAFASGSEQFGYENLTTWTTSSGTALPNRRVLTAGAPLGSLVYGLISLV